MNYRISNWPLVTYSSKRYYYSCSLIGIITSLKVFSRLIRLSSFLHQPKMELKSLRVSPPLSQYFTKPGDSSYNGNGKLPSGDYGRRSKFVYVCLCVYTIFQNSVSISHDSSCTFVKLAETH